MEWPLAEAREKRLGERQNGWAMDALSLGVQCSGVRFPGDYR